MIVPSTLEGGSSKISSPPGGTSLLITSPLSFDTTTCAGCELGLLTTTAYCAFAASTSGLKGPAASKMLSRSSAKNSRPMYSGGSTDVGCGPGVGVASAPAASLFLLHAAAASDTTTNARNDRRRPETIPTSQSRRR